jgi:hypothetical protein
VFYGVGYALSCFSVTQHVDGVGFFSMFSCVFNLVVTVSGTPFVPLARAMMNQRKRRLVGKHRRAVRQGLYLL